MANKDLNLIINAKDEASSTIEKVGWKLSEFSERNKRKFQWMAAAGTAAMAGIWAATKSLVNTAENAVSVEKNLEAQLNNLWDSSDLSREKIKGLNDELRQQTWLTDTTIDKMAQLWLQYWATSRDELEELIRNSARLTASTEWANATQETYIDTLRDLAEAYKDPWGVIEQLASKWMTFNETFKEQIKTLQENWNEAEAYNKIMQRLDWNLWKLNEIIPETTKKQGNLRNQWQNLKETLWKALIPVMDKVVTKLNTILKPVTEWIRKNPQLSKNITLVAWAVSWLWAALWWLWLVLWPISTAVTALWAVIWWLSAPIIAIIWAVWALAVAWKTNFWWIQQKTQVVIDKLVVLMQNFLSWAKSIWNKYWKDIYVAVNWVFTDISKIIKTTIIYIKWIFSAFWWETKHLWKSSLATLWEWIKKFWWIAFDFLKKALWNIKNLFVWNFKIIKWIVSTVLWVITWDWDKALKWLKTAAKWFFTNLKAIFNLLKNTLVALWRTMYLSLRQNLKQFVIWWKWIFRGLKETFVLILQSLKNLFTNIWWAMWDWITNKTENAVDFVRDKFEWLVEWVKWAIDNLKSLWDSAKDIWDKAWKAYSKIPGVKNVEKIWENVRNTVTWQRQMWGPVRANQSYLVWENWPEIFTPNSSWKVKNNMSWWNTININMWGVVVKNEADENRLVEKMKREIFDEFKFSNLWFN